MTLATRTFDATGEIQETSAHHFNHDKLFRDLGQPPRDRAERVTYNRKRGIRTAGTSECHGERDGRARDRSTLGPDAADSRFEVDELAATGASFLGEAAVDGVAVPRAGAGVGQDPGLRLRSRAGLQARPSRPWVL